MYRPTSVQLQELANKTNELLDADEAQAPDLLDRTLTQLEVAAKQFVDNNVDPGADMKALRLLSQRSIDTEGHRKAHDLLDLQENSVPLNTYVEDTDIDNHLKIYHDEIILHALHDCMETTAVEFERRVSHQLENDWRRAQVEILSSVGQRGGQDVMLWNTGDNYGNHNTSGLQDLSFSRTQQLENMNNDNTQQRYLQNGGSNGLGPDSGFSQQQQQRNAYFSGRVRLSRLQELYHECIKSLNELRRVGREVRWPLLTHFQKACASEDGVDGVQREVSWDLLRTMIGEARHESDVHQYNGPAQAQYRQERLSRDPSVQKHYQMRFVNGGIKYLQDQWRRTMEEETAGTGEYSTNMSESIGLIKAYLRATDDEGADRNPWAIVYYCLRCGAYDDAINVFHQVISRSHNYDWSGTNRANEPENIVHGLECWRNCFDNSSSGNGGKSNSKDTSMDWKAYVKTTFKNTSPNAMYKRAVLTLLAQMVGEGRAGEGSQHIVHQLEGLDVSSTIEDFMWHQLSIVVTSTGVAAIANTNDSFNNFTMENLSDVIMKVYGPDHFSPDNTDSFRYFMLLLYCLQFERALTYLAVNAGRPEDAVHFAIALDHYGILKRSGEQGIQNQPRRKSGFGNDSSISNSQTPSRNKKINPGVCIDEDGNFVLGQMVNDYIERVSGADITVAADYLCVLHKPSGNLGNANQLERDRFLTKLLFNAHEKQLDQLLGAQDGSSTGYLRKIISDNTDVQRIISAAARNAEGKNNLERAISLYWRAKLFDRVLHLVNLQLGQVIVPSSFGTGNSNNKTRQPKTLKRARDLAGMIKNGTARNVSDKERDTLYILLQLDQFFVLVHEKKDYGRALQLIQRKNVDLLPNDSSEYERQAKRARFNELGEPITKNFHKVLEDYMMCLVRMQQQAVTNRNMTIGGRNNGSNSGNSVRNQFQNSNGTNFQNEKAYEQQINLIRSKAEAIMSFTAWLKHKLPQDTYSKLAHYEMQITKVATSGGR